MDALTILWKQLNAMWVAAVASLPTLVIALLVLIITWAAARFAKKIADKLTARTHMRVSLQQLVETVVGIGIWVIGLMIAATIVLPGLTPASLLAGLGIGTVAIGFAFQDIFQNFLAGVLIMIRKKMRIGDLIECGDIMGKVEHITLRETHVRKLSNELTIVPNSKLFKEPVEIITDADERRHEIIAGVAYDTDLEQARDVILSAVKGAEGVKAERGIDVFAREFNSSSIDFTVRWWAGAMPGDMHRTRDAVIRAIKRAFDAEGIEIPFPYLTHTFKEPMRIARADPDAMREAAE
ncbi:mechanosensitive ion channel [Sphingomonas sp. ST-64]|uniref:Small-conductance mechanosensitive channel n=1 Tax=Sphingomonas plantiphila TaxID=3163295 RepID=A0ABW8YQT0_9SPHN